MKRISQTQDAHNDDSLDLGVMLSPRTLLTGPRQIVRLERQYRSVSEDLQNALQNINRTKDAYITALQNYEQAEAYIKQVTPKLGSVVRLLNSASSNSEYLEQATQELQMLISGSQPSERTSQTATARPWPTAPPPTPGAASGAMVGVGTGASTGAGTVANSLTKSQTTPVNNTSGTSTVQQEQTRVQNAQQINALKMQLNSFVTNIYRQYNAHKKRASAMENQYNLSKSTYAKIRANFFQLQNEIDNLSTNLSGWNERLMEYYSPTGGEE